MNKAIVKVNEIDAGILWEDEEGFHFQYNDDYIRQEGAKPVSLTLPLKGEAYFSKTLFPFFDGLIPEGWLLNIVTENWKIQFRDRMALLLATGKDCIGNVSIHSHE